VIAVALIGYNDMEVTDGMTTGGDDRDRLLPLH
jgi:hypothetical protein